MRLPWANWSNGAKIATVALFAVTLMMLILGLNSWKAGILDRVDWPQSAHQRIENMASIIRRLRSPARWCHPSDNPENIYEFEPEEKEQDFGRCLSAIAPVSDFQETQPGYYVRRFYRGQVDDKFCEVTLSTVFEGERIVGSDCYFGWFPKAKDGGVGMTDDKFG
jgi:hypothetical protein